MKIAIATTKAIYNSPAKKLAKQLQLPVTSIEDKQYDCKLVYTKDYLEVRYSIHHQILKYHVDFLSGPDAHRRQYGGGYGQLIARAVGASPNNTLKILDATAGFGRDAFILACLGCKMTLIEQSPIIATLTHDGLERLNAVDTSLQLQLIIDDAINFMQQTKNQKIYDVVYLDPMYPAKPKSAKIKKPSQLLQLLASHEQNESLLLKAALQCAKKRVVVKRPCWAQPIERVKRHHFIASKKTRYDVYFK